MAEPADKGPAVDSMIVSHRYYRGQLAQAPMLVRELRAGNATRIRLVIGHVYAVVLGLQNHDRDEDDLLWPLLRARIDPPPEAIGRVENQHHQLSALTTRVRQALTDLLADADLTMCEPTAELLTELSEAADAHMLDEEKTILPLVAEHLTATEWTEYAARGISRMSKAQRRYAKSAMFAYCTPDEQAIMLAKLSVWARLMWQLHGQHVYPRHLARIHGR
ncbi:hemerythrin domain-containing protein [Nocardia sp. CDC160]|uniref:hemerythrin domain-containing protein n=1 Tax=Nocardia sp. CDC160 TaxID=3112166 RepID=UPI002DB59FBC|nr:hemerythrin domain-containing protein [Nocardia sp. CDC160]MEC3917913.1 hemerythrin domain-containing protein [Nocardia sp. CDC160]